MTRAALILATLLMWAVSSVRLNGSGDGVDLASTRVMAPQARPFRPPTTLLAAVSSESLPSSSHAEASGLSGKSMGGAPSTDTSQEIFVYSLATWSRISSVRSTTRPSVGVCTRPTVSFLPWPALMLASLDSLNPKQASAIRLAFEERPAAM